jgi:hypothetical protein
MTACDQRTPEEKEAEKEAIELARLKEDRQIILNARKHYHENKDKIVGNIPNLHLVKARRSDKTHVRLEFDLPVEVTYYRYNKTGKWQLGYIKLDNKVTKVTSYAGDWLAYDLLPLIEVEGYFQGDFWKEDFNNLTEEEKSKYLD